MSWDKRLISKAKIARIESDVCQNWKDDDTFVAEIHRRLLVAQYEKTIADITKGKVTMTSTGAGK